MKKDGEGDQIMKALDKFDKILMVTLRVLELKKSIYETIDKIKQGINELSTYRPDIQNSLLDLSNIEEIAEKEIQKQESKSVYILLTSVLLLI